MDSTLRIDQLTGTALPAQRRSAASFHLSADGIVLLAVAGDAVAVLLGLTLAMWGRVWLGLQFPLKEFQPDIYMNLFGFGIVAYIAFLQISGSYRKSQFLRRFSGFKLAFSAAWMWAAAFVLATLIFEVQGSIPRLFMLMVLFNTIALVGGWRMLLHWMLEASNWASLLRDRVIVVGWSKESEALSQMIAKDPTHTYEVIGCTPSAHGKFWVKPPRQVPVLGDYNSVRDLLSQHQPNVLLLADLDPVMGELVSLAQLCVKENVRFKVIPSFFQILASGLKLESDSGVPILGISKLPLDYVHNRVIKRVVDIVGACVGLMLSAPIIAIFGIMIYRESPGSIFYSQTRSGMGGRVFKIYKLRSMKLNAEANGPQWTKENDPRRLKIGEFMRKTNIDEVPQFWNVLTGEMSLVGPRPERPELIKNFKEEITHYNARHYAKPGISGYAQVNGMRGNTDLSERIRYDLKYLENWSLWLDIQIMIRTFFVRTNAY